MYYGFYSNLSVLNLLLTQSFILPSLSLLSNDTLVKYGGRGLVQNVPARVKTDAYVS